MKQVRRCTEAFEKEYTSIRYAYEGQSHAPND